MTDDRQERIHAVFSRTLRVPADSLHDELRRGTIEQWDSLGHLNLVTALNEEFGVQLSPERALAMHTIGDIKRIIGELL